MCIKPLYWSIMWKILSFFIFESVISDKILYFSRSRNAQVSFIEKPQLKIFKIIQNYEKGSEGYGCESGIAILAWKFNWNYAYSPFKLNFKSTYSSFFQIKNSTKIFFRKNFQQPIFAKFKPYFTNFFDKKLTIFEMPWNI